MSEALALAAVVTAGVAVHVYYTRRTPCSCDTPSPKLTPEQTSTLTGVRLSGCQFGIPITDSSMSRPTTTCDNLAVLAS